MKAAVAVLARLLTELLVKLLAITLVYFGQFSLLRSAPTV